MKDNRNYKYLPDSVLEREEYDVILNWIPKVSKVVDLGCGDGSLLKILEKKGIKGEGVEISKSGVNVCLKKGLKVKKGRIDIPLKYNNNQFNYAICNVTLQMVTYPEILIKEMVRISKKQIISFPNFAYSLNRLDLLINGRMPKFGLLNYDWYSTGQIHQLSLKDFYNFCQDNNYKIIKQHHLVPKAPLIPRSLLRRFPNLFSSVSILMISK